MHKPVMWDGKPLKGIWQATIKIDGIRVLKNTAGEIVSRNGKPLYNMDHLADHINEDGCEVYCNADFSSTVRKVRTKHGGTPVHGIELFSLNPIDARLALPVLVDPSAGTIWQMYKKVVKMGYEGLVLRQGEKWLKVKKYETIDVRIVGVYEGKGKYTGMLGGFITEKGRVGAGLSDEQRKTFYDAPYDYVGMFVECKCMEITSAGKMRKPRFIRLRPDK